MSSIIGLTFIVIAALWSAGITAFMLYIKVVDAVMPGWVIPAVVAGVAVSAIGVIAAMVVGLLTD